MWAMEKGMPADGKKQEMIAQGSGKATSDKAVPHHACRTFSERLDPIEDRDGQR
jgi:hypothetical protein